MGFCFVFGNVFFVFAKFATGLLVCSGAKGLCSVFVFAGFFFAIFFFARVFFFLLMEFVLFFCMVFFLQGFFFVARLFLFTKKKFKWVFCFVFSKGFPGLDTAQIAKVYIAFI